MTSRQEAGSRQILLFTFMRWVTNTNLRMLYPFLAVFARGMGVDILSISLVISTRFLLAMFSPLLAPIADRLGRKTAMLAGMMVFTTAVALVYFFPTFPVFFITHCAAFLGGFLVMTSIQAYLGDHVPYEQRGRMFGILEMGWSLAFLLGMPLVAFLVGRFGWQSPFPMLAVFGLLIIFALQRMVPGDRPVKGSQPTSWEQYRSILRSPIVLYALAMTAVLGVYSEVIFMIFGVWMEDAFGLLIAGLGLVSALLGIAELGGEALTFKLADRLGKLNAIRTGVIISAVVAVALLFATRSMPLALAGLVLFTLGFEFAYVSSVPFLSEILPASRATFLGINAAALALGRGAATVISPIVYNYGIQANLLVALAACLAALLIVARLKQSVKGTGKLG